MGARASRALLIERGSGPAAARVESAMGRRRKRCMAVCEDVSVIGFGAVI